ncbi:MAG TPA: hypothetical protein DCE23_07470 [Firmicutes bacterium]|nr:hypothetical protein [Bacillota bacterium]
MEKIDSVVEKFISNVEGKVKRRIITILVYGSRVLNTARQDSDLDIMVIAEGNRNYRLGDVIDGIKIDCILYGINNIYDVMEEKKRQGNTFFGSILDYGYVYQDLEDVIPIMKAYLEELDDIRTSKRKISNRMAMSLKAAIEVYLEYQDDYSYYNLLEIIRGIYHYKGFYSFLSLNKVVRIYEESDRYEENYSLRLPKNSFRELFLRGIKTFDIAERKGILRELISLLNIDLDSLTDTYQEEKMFSDDEIKYKLLIFYNRCANLEKMLDMDSSTFKYIYYVTLKQLLEFGKIIKCEKIDYRQERNINGDSSNLEMMKYIWQVFLDVGRNYHFDYKKYMIKL